MSELVQAFYLDVDGKRYGPYVSSEEDRVKRLMHLKGVKVSPVMIDKAAFKKQKVKKVKPQNLSLLDGLEGWLPIRRG